MTLRRVAPAALSAVALFGGTAHGQSPATLVRDIDAAPAVVDSLPDSFTALGDRTAFVAWTPEHGRELWITDGSGPGTALIADINPGPAASDPAELVEFAGQLLFSADDGAHGRELWRSDGTSAGTRLVADVGPGSLDGLTTQSLLGAARAGVLFLAYDPDHGRELWSSDGTGPGTALIADITPGTSGSFSFAETQPAANVGGVLFFVADDRQHGAEVWESDGSAQGTRLVGDIAAGPESSFPRKLVAGDDAVFFLARDPIFNYELWSARPGAEPVRLTSAGAEPVGASPLAPPFQLVYLDGLLYFDAPDLEIGREPWRSDGTPNGTFALGNIRPGVEGSFPSGFTAFAGRVFFSAKASDTDAGLWSTDSSAPGTTRLVLPNDIGVAQTLPSTDHLFFFLAYTEREISLWRSDGTSAAGTFPVAVFANGGVRPPSEPSATADLLFFVADDGSHGAELWRSDGTTAGTHLLRDIRPGAEGSLGFADGDQARSFAHNALLFRADDGVHGRELWIADGSTAALLADIARDDIGLESSAPDEITSAAGALYFSATDREHGREIWTSDGTTGGTLLVSDLNPGEENSDPAFFTALDAHHVLFAATDAAHGRELWSTDGSARGTRLVADVDPVASSDPQSLVNLAGRVLFTADDGERGRELWVSDGTEYGTALLRDINPQRGESSSPVLGSLLDGRVYFTANDGEHGRELWVSDGSAAGTRLLLDLHSGPADGVFELIVHAGQLYFIGDSGGGAAVWRSDAQGRATRLSAPRAVRELAAAGDHLFYFADYYDLWTLDLRRGEESFVRFLHPASGQAIPRDLRALGEVVLFRAGTSNSEVWSSDGTGDGTHRIAGALERTLIRSTGQVVFNRDGEVWIGSADLSREHLLADIAPGAAPSSPGPFVEHRGLLFFAADDQRHGRELWAISIAAFAETCVGDCDGDGRVSIAELVRGVGIALGRQPIDRCSALDSDGDAQVDVAELVSAVRVGLESCPLDNR